jgi:hypothetical protein
MGGWIFLEGRGGRDRGKCEISEALEGGRGS